MKNIWFVTLISIVWVAVSCSKDNSADETVYTATFDTDGGNPIPSAQHVKKREILTMPATNPGKTGYVFLFWYMDGVTTAYNFQLPVNSDVTLRAKWQEESTAEYWQVSWQLNDGVWPAGNNHATQVVKGGTLGEPVEPIKAGYTFEGWYKEANLINKITFPYDVSHVVPVLPCMRNGEQEVRRAVFP